LPPTNLKFRFFIVDLPEANAFVLPGGRIYVSRKLIGFVQNEDELAGVISHEIGHLVARQGSQDMTFLMKEVLNVTSVTDRKDIFAKYNLLMDNVARNQKAFKKVDNESEKDQVIADQIGLFALAAAGYDPQAQVRFWDRFAETKGKTGSALSDFFGTTSPEAKRLREMLRNVSTLPSICVEARNPATSAEFSGWQSAVVNYVGLGKKEAIHGLVSKTVLDPALQSEISHLRFSPDGKYVLAQDDSGMTILTREPFASLFRIDAVDARKAQFTPDSKSVLFHNSNLRVELWDIGDQKLKVAHDMVVRKDCAQTALSPEGKFLACLDIESNLFMFDVNSGNQVFQKKPFYYANPLDFLVMELNLILNSGDFGDQDLELINMGFSPDGKYFLAGKRGGVADNPFATYDYSLALDLSSMAQVQLKGPGKKLIPFGFAFIAADKLVVPNEEDPKKAAIISFPSCDIVDQLTLGAGGKLAAATKGNYLLIRPIGGYAVGVMNLGSKIMFKGGKNAAMDIYDRVFVAERTNGELAIYSVDKNEMLGKVTLPRNSLGKLRAMALSQDFKWLAVSERTRGAVWDMAKGSRITQVRGFRGGYFGGDGFFYADFPKLGKVERSMGKMDLSQPTSIDAKEIEDYRAKQYGQYVVLTKPNKKGGRYEKDVTVEVRDTKTLGTVWSKVFPKESPDTWIDSRSGTMVLVWPTNNGAAKTEIKSDAHLGQEMSTMKDKEGNYLLQVYDAGTGKISGQLIIATGKGSFHISDVFAVKDWVIISDSENRVLVYKLSTGEQKGKVFGGRAAVAPTSGLFCVENETGQLTVYDIETMEKRDEFTFSGPLAMVRFDPDGKKLFVLGANQTAYVLDVSSAIH